jgi:ABC-2 type transport system permease protein
VLYLSVVTDWDPAWISLESLDEAVDWVWLFASIGAVAVAVGPVVAERRRGTAGWVVSKPVSRRAYVVGKVVAHSLGVAVSMVLIPGLIAYWWLPHVGHARGFAPPLPPFGRYLGALGMIVLLCTFLVALVVMVGTLVKRRGPTTGVALAVLILLYLPPGDFEWVRFWPGKLVDWLRPTELSALAEYVFGGAPATEALLVTATAIVFFTGVAVGAFRRAEL